MLFGLRVVLLFIAISSISGLPAFADSCSTLEEYKPPFLVVSSNHALNESTMSGMPRAVFFPKGTIVRVDPSEVAHVWGTAFSFNTGIMPRVKVLSVPDNKPSMSLSNSGQQAKQLFNNDGGIGQRALVGMEANILASDLGSVLKFGESKPNVDTPANVIFEVRRDTQGAISPELRGKAIKLDYDNATETFAVKRCCPNNVPSQEGLKTGKRYPYENVRNSDCTYMPIYEVLKAIDRGAGLPPTFTVERRIAATDCDPLTASLSPVSAQNQREIFSLLENLRRPGDQALVRLQRAAWQTATAHRKPSSLCPRATGNGNSPKCWCKQGVNETGVASGLLPSPIPKGDAHTAANFLPRMGFTNIINNFPSSRQAPIGAILVYNKVGGGAGHIEIKVDDNMYCSDFCKETPIDSYIPGRKLVGIYMRKGS